MHGERVRIKIDVKPHSNNQLLTMNAFRIPGLLEMWVACGSKWGKTLSLSTAMSTTLPLSHQALYRWVAPIYRQAEIGYNYTRRLLPGEPHVKANDSRMHLYMPRIDSKLEFFHGQYPESLEGEATEGTVLDEAAKMKRQVYDSVKTTTGVTAGPIIGISTPLGQNWFYDKCMEAKQEMLDAKRQGRRPRKIYIHAPSTSNPTLSPEYLIDAKKSFTDRLYRQYILAEFIGTGDIFPNLTSLYTTDYIEYAEEQFRWSAVGVENMDVVIGVDWARINDYTVFTASDPHSRRIVAIWRMQGVPYPVQIKRLKAFAESFKSVYTVWHDKTGVGVALDDMLHATELPFKGITFTNATKNEMMVKLILSFEDQSYRIPYINHLSKEMNGLGVKTSALGLTSYAAEGTGHDDLVMSMALSHLAMEEHSVQDYGIILF